MGKFLRYISILIFLDLIFILTGQINFSSIGSIIINGIINLKSLTLTDLFSQIIGQVGSLASSSSGLASLILGGLVTIGTIFSKSDTILFIPVGITFGLLTSDLILIGTYLSSLNSILATVLIAPLGIIYILTVMEWVRGKD